MGCCMEKDRNTSFTQKASDQGFKSKQNINKKKKEPFADSKANQIFQVLETFNYNQEWHTQKTNPELNCTVKIQIGSEFNLKIPVNCIYFTIKNCSTAKIRKLMYDPVIRTQWDKAILKLEYTEYEDDHFIAYIENKFPWPLKNRVVTEQYFQKATEKELKVVFYSVPFKYEGSLVQAETVFGISTFKRQDQDVICQCISQSNFKISLQEKFAKLGLEESFNWVKALQNYALQFERDQIQQ